MLRDGAFPLISHVSCSVLHARWKCGKSHFSSIKACRAWLIYDIIDVFFCEMLLFGSLYSKGVITMVFSNYIIHNNIT